MKTYSILLVDDDPIILKGIGTILRRENYRITPAETGSAAIEILSKNTFDIAITDVVMDQFDGIQVLKHIKRQYPETMVIILTGYNNISTAIDALRLDADDYLLKPCEPEEILFRVHNCVEKLERRIKLKKAERSQRENEQRLSLALDVTKAGIWDYNIKTNKVIISQKILDPLGNRKGDAEGTIDAAKTIHHPEEWDALQAALSAHVQGKTAEFIHEHRVLTKDGEWRWFFNRAKIVERDENGNPERLLGIMVDITEKKRLETQIQQSHKMESIGTLAGGIAHDFNNLLSAILGYTELTQNDLQPENKIYHNLSEVKKACLTAKGLTGQLLTFSKGGSPIKKTGLLGNLLKNTAKFVLSGSKASCDFALPEDLWPAEFDEAQMKQVISSLIINAHEAMPKGGHIRISAENIDVEAEETIQGFDLPPGRYIRILIKDQGIGIPKENMGKVFDPYFSTKEMGAAKGMGLGLSICHSIIDKHDGYITLDSEVAAGTTALIYLPASKKEITERKPIETPTPKPISRKGKILVMDDEEMLRDVANSMLTHMGYDVTCAKDGMEAIEMYKRAKGTEKPFNTVILDLTVKGGMGGKQAIESLLQFDPGIKAIVSSGYYNDPVMTDCRQYGFCDAVAKPYKIDVLSKTLDRIMEE